MMVDVIEMVDVIVDCVPGDNGYVDEAAQGGWEFGGDDGGDGGSWGGGDSGGGDDGGGD